MHNGNAMLEWVFQNFPCQPVASPVCLGVEQWNGLHAKVKLVLHLCISVLTVIYV